MKSKNAVPDDMNEEEDDVEAIGQQSEGDLGDEDPEVDLLNALWSAFSRLSTLQDELAHRQ